MAVRLGELLVRDGCITPGHLQDALHYQRRHGGRLGASLVKLGRLTEDDLAGAVGRQAGVPTVNLHAVEPDAAALRLIPPDAAARYMALPLARSGEVLTIALADPTNVVALDDIRFMTGLNLEPVVAGETAMREAIARSFGGSSTPFVDPSATDLVAGLPGSAEIRDEGLDVIAESGEVDPSSDRQGGDASIVRFVNALLLAAIRKGASDIHIEPYEHEVRVRFRVDGQLHTVMSPPVRSRDAMVSRVKILARLDIAEKRLPQDGRIKARFTERGRRRDIDLRVSVLPVVFGEKVVLRLLDPEGLELDLLKLGFGPDGLDRFERAIRRPWGMVLVTGPTGSGKTSTLYSALGQINRPGVNIMTVEDPVEFSLAGINQVQVRESIGLTFAHVLRSFLRQDPNVILVGEIRDAETAGIAVKAALTGHLVLSTLHTNDAPTSVHRLVNMGVEPFLVANSVNLVCAQRLVRRVCDACSAPHEVPAGDLVEAGADPLDARLRHAPRGKGCDLCGGSGYRGRIGLFEVMEMTDGLRTLVVSNVPAADVRRQALSEGMVTLRESGLSKVRDGVTTLDEVVRETM
jgi:type IV pilus assembly protein PilB